MGLCAASLGGMNTAEQLYDARHTGLSMLQFCMRAPRDVAAALDIRLAEVKRWAKIGQVYYGQTRYTKQQRKVVAAAEGYSIDRLDIVERFAKKAKDAGQEWKIRLQLLEAGGSIENVQRVGKAIFEDLEREDPPAEPEPGVRLSQNTADTWTLHIRSSATQISRLLKTLEPLMPEGPETRERKLVDAFWTMLDNNYSLVVQKYRTVIAVGVPDLWKILHGKGDEVILGCSDGTQMRGAEWLNALMNGQMDKDIFAGLFHPTAGPVNLYQTRFADFKQRLLAMCEQLVCAWEDCNVPADRCEVHHILAHKYGGNTEPANLTMLCPYHNGKAGTGPPDNAPYGWITREKGRPAYQPAWGGPTRRNNHPVGKLGAHDLIRV